jgi:magnesium chelatase family protein
MVQRYQSCISGPLLDRIDIHLDIPRLSFHDLTTLKAGEPSSAIRTRVEAARARQLRRFADHKKKGLRLNADMGPAEVQEHVVLDDDGMAVLRTAMRQMQLTARGVHRVLKLSRTIADLDNTEHVTMMHLAEALQYRPRIVAV